MVDEEKLSNEEAEALLKRLTAHYGQPVMPIRKYCQALDTWATVHHERSAHLRRKAFPGMSSNDRTVMDAAWKEYHAEKIAHEKRTAFERNDFTKAHGDRAYLLEDLWRAEDKATAIDGVFLNIRKSNLLARLLYEGEPLRTERCPIHDGTWSGIGTCQHGCGQTGWLMAEETLAKITKKRWQDTIASHERWLETNLKSSHYQNKHGRKSNEELRLYIEWLKAQLAKRFP